ncbi:MAG TPA: hypothetical protein VFZ11_15035 [Gemmatimonadaceae bacterium]
MYKFLFALVIGLAAGYFVGFKDAQKNREHVVARMVARVGGDTRERVKTDFEKTEREAERR